MSDFEPGPDERARDPGPEKGTRARIVSAYLEDAEGDPYRALYLLLDEALADLTEAERRTRLADRVVSRGYVCGRCVADLFTHRGGPKPG